ncbi:S41 family peptidase [Pseudoalteromonas umbrosa]|uniref:S41 family peptidase n=1 Tax=Pseudoalteromonas umbrosa TaxID=3048489 RepID=UPI0024C33AA8|nr:S41 family peptidase [Pseudoalteromonas sp. B95]MDK1286479.1 S41 family peptidase [Pseudoalteromonas sp. B95]
MKRSILASTLALVLSSTALANNYAPLSEVREQIKSPEYTQQEKQLVVEQARIFLEDLYVHQYAKDIYYGISPNGHVNAVSEIHKLIDELDAISTDEMHSRLTKIFKAQRDLHLVYVHPQPVRSYASYLPFEFDKTSDLFGNSEVRVSNLFESLVPYVTDSRLPEVGDKVVSYNGKPIHQVVEDNLYVGFGANEDAGFIRALSAITRKGHALSLVPEDNDVTIEFISHATGETYTTTIPWITRVPATSANSESTANVGQLLEESTNFEADQHHSIKAELDTDSGAPFFTNPSADPEVSWAIREVDGQQVGYIKLDRFRVVGEIDNSLRILSELLTDELADTDALVFDVRDNPGGYITYADRLVQLFTPKLAKPTELKFINTKLNYDILHNTIFSTFGPQWQKVLADVTGTNARYTDTASYITVAQNNEFGQSYYKPVGVWSDARTYSSGDVFTCSVQDNGVAKVYGEHKRTGAGGANVMRHSVFSQYVGAPYFEALPYGQEMTVSWRQMIRHGHNKNAIIEDFGCVADKHVPKTLESIKDSGLGNFETIARDLLSEAPNKSTVRFLQSRVTDLSTAGRTFSLEVTNTELVEIYLNDVKVDVINISAYGDSSKTVEYTIPASSIEGQVRFIGLDGGKAPLWNGIRYFN